MARKIGDLGVTLTILFFLVTGMTYVFLNMDIGLGVTSGVTTDFSNITDSLDEVSVMQVEFSEQLDNASELAPTTQEQNVILLEKRASSGSGVLNLFSKNIFISFINVLAQKFSLPTPVIILVIGLIGVTITILGIRFFFGEGKI